MSLKTSNPIKLNDVRLSYPSLFRRTVHPKAPADAKPKYQASFILDKVEHAKEIDTIKKAIENLLTENKTSIQKLKDICFKDGDDSDKEEYKNKYILNAKSINSFPVVGKDGITPVHEDDNMFYAGCYVSAYITLYFYNEISTGMTANIKAVQFRKDGVSFGNEPMKIDGAFEPIEEENALF
jgi:hypothetical protein